MTAVLTRRELGRAVLARQQLLVRGAGPADEMIGRLVGLQAQAAPEPPYLGLWSRLADFRPEQLTELLEQRRVVRVALQRGTIHLVTAADCLALRPLLQPVLDRGLRGSYGRQLAGLDVAEVAARGRELVERQPMTFQQLGERLGPHWPEHDPASLAQAVRAVLTLVQVPPRGLWGRSGPAAHTTAEHWLGREPEAAPSLDDLVLRYLGAFGPASAADVQKWCGLTGLGKVLARLAPELAVFRDEQGRTLYDLPDAPRPGGDTPAPVRLLAPFDNLLLSYADRSRVLPEEYRHEVMTPNGLVPGTLLVDGLVAGVWRTSATADGGVLTVRRFAGTGDRAVVGGIEEEIAEEGERLARFLGVTFRAERTDR
ncbi:winged helix DNA-binding domain-containing protein [Kitasatospora sp. McL0602]|uniref:winged helix DNA-binding domain-containing protein n=1 Tax=Kitasatospora sp. McL0602 TaxID=3439530 RepID=UPI003F8CA04B